MRLFIAAFLMAPLALMLSNCAVNLKQVPDPPVVRAPLTRCNVPVYMGRLDVRSKDRNHRFEQNLKRSLAAYIAERRAFPIVSELPDRPDTMPPHHLILDADLRIDFSDDYNWWVTWPAVYPMPAYWPFQVRKGESEVRLTVTVVDESGATKLRLEKSEKAEDTVVFYGFFRASALEHLMRSTLSEIFRTSAEAIAAAGPALCQDDTSRPIAPGSSEAVP